jgi:predicted enzyme related to lactoylglutathione lyase
MSVDPTWLTAFLDLPADVHDAGTAFWQDVTGWPLSEPRGAAGEFATFVPAQGDAVLKVQRTGGKAAVHLDLHVADPDAAAQEAVGLGATVSADHGDYWVLASPAGLAFCLVGHAAGARPAPRTWPGGRTSVVDQVSIDVPPGRYAEEFEFWAALTGWSRRDPRPETEFARLTPDASVGVQLILQRLADEQPTATAHLDFAADDRDAEVADHAAAGAEVLGRHDEWTVLRDPAGLRYCVTDRRPGTRARH